MIWVRAKGTWSNLAAGEEPRNCVFHHRRRDWRPPASDAVVPRLRLVGNASYELIADHSHAD